MHKPSVLHTSNDLPFISDSVVPFDKVQSSPIKPSNCIYVLAVVTRHSWECAPWNIHWFDVLPLLCVQIESMEIMKLDELTFRLMQGTTFHHSHQLHRCHQGVLQLLTLCVLHSSLEAYPIVPLTNQIVLRTLNNLTITVIVKSL